MNNFRFKVVGTDGTHYFVSLFFRWYGECFVYAQKYVRSSEDIKQVDIYTCKNDRLIATFYH